MLETGEDSAEEGELGLETGLVVELGLNEGEDALGLEEVEQLQVFQVHEQAEEVQGGKDQERLGTIQEGHLGLDQFVLADADQEVIVQLPVGSPTEDQLGQHAQGLRLERQQLSEGQEVELACLALQIHLVAVIHIAADGLDEGTLD